MDNFINVIKKDPQVQMKLKDILDKNIRLSYNCQSKTVYDILIFRM